MAFPALSGGQVALGMSIPAESTSWVLLVGSANNLPAIQDPVLHSFFWAQLTCAVLGSLPSWTWQTLCSLETYASFTSETYAQAGLSGLGMLLN